MAAKKSGAMKTVADNAAQATANQIVNRLKWTNGISKPHDQSFSIMDDNYSVKDIAKFKRVDVLDEKCYRTDDNNDRVILKGEISLIPGLMISDDRWSPSVLTKSNINDDVFLDEDDDDEDYSIPRWEADIPGLTNWHRFCLYPDGTFSIGCQRHQLAEWVRMAKIRLSGMSNEKRDIAALALLVPMLQEFLRTHKPPVKEKVVKPEVTLAQFRQMLLARLDEPVVYKKKTVRKKTATKKAKK